MIVILNNRDEGREVTIKVYSKVGISRMEEVRMTRLIRSCQDGYTDQPKEIIARAGMVNLYLPPKSVTLLHHKDKM